MNCFSGFPGLMRLVAFASLILSSIAAQAALVDVKRNANIIYAAYSAPNKIVRYDLENETFLDEIRLTYSPGQIAIADNQLYFTSGYNIYRLEADGSQTFILSTAETNSTRSIIGFVVTDDIYLVSNSNESFTFRRSDNSFIQRLYYSVPENVAYHKADNNTIIRTDTGYQNCRVITIADDTFNATTQACAAATNPYRSDSSIKAAITSNEDTIFSSNGFNYHKDSLEVKSSFGSPYTEIALTQDEHAIIYRDSKLSYLSETGELKGTYTLATASQFLTVYGNTVFSLSSNNYSASIDKIDLNTIQWPTQKQAPDPESSFRFTSVHSNNADTLYFIDNQQLLIRTWDKTSGTFSTSYPLRDTVADAFYSNGYLYLTGSDFSISRYDFSQQIPVQEYIGFLPESVSWVTHHNDTQLLAQQKDDYYVLLDRKTGWLDYERSSRKTIRSYRNDNLSHLFVSDTETYSFTISNNKISNRTLTSYQDTNVNSPFVDLSKNGQLLINATGNLFKPGNRASLNTLNQPVSSAVWFTDNLVTFDSTTRHMTVWDSNYLKLAGRELSSASPYLFNLGEDLVIVEHQSIGNIVDINRLSFASDADADTDNIKDILDNCPLIANTDQADTDGDSKGNVCDIDDDNDLIPDLVESDNGLDPFNASDALQDKDNDGIHNLAEYQLNTDISDSTSYPEKISHLDINFSNGNISPMYSYRSGWSVAENGYESTRGIISSAIKGDKQSSSIFLTHNFSAGVMNFKHSVVSGSSNYTLTIYIDDLRVERFYEYDNEWNTRIFSITEGVHTIEFRLTSLSTFPYGIGQHRIDEISFELDQDSDTIPDSADNCPTISNYYQEDDDNNGIGNACDGYYADNDADGVQNYIDNCPAMANAGQENLDRDQYGDACDSDIDGDRISNTLEEKYDFLDPFDPRDAYLDYDNDGISNLDEILSGTQPDEYNEKKIVSVLDYFPIGSLDILTTSGSYTMRPTGKSNEYLVTTVGTGFYQKLQVTEIGIFRTEAYIPENDLTLSFSAYLLLPKQLTLNDAYYYSYEVRFSDGQPTVAVDARIKLIETGITSWQGKEYEYISIDDDGYVSTYLKGIGYAFEGTPGNGTLTLLDITIHTLDDTSIVKDSGDGSSGGALYWLIIAGLLILSTQRRSKA